MRIPWKKPKEATAAELRADLERAKADVAAAKIDERAAWSKFRESGGDPSASKAHDAAKSAADDARKHELRLLEDVPAAEARESEAERVRLRARRDELRGQLTHGAVLAACASDHRRAADCLIAFADARIALARRAEGLRALERELERVLDALGEWQAQGVVDLGDGTSTIHHSPEYSSLCASAHKLMDVLSPHIDSLPAYHPLHALMQLVIASGPVHFTGKEGK